MAFKAITSHVNLRAVIDSDSTESVSVFVHARTSLTYEKFNALSAYVNLNVANFILDADTKNRYFTADASSPNALTATLSEAIALSAELAKTEGVSLTEASSIAFGMPNAEAITLSDSLSRVLTYIRAPSDSVTVGESSRILLEGRTCNAAPLNTVELN